MTKRAASYDIDPNTYEQTERTSKPESFLQANDPQMKGRKIFSIIKKQQPSQIEQNKNNKPTLNIPGLFSKPNDSNKEENATPEKQRNNLSRSLFGSNNGTNLFSNLFSADNIFNQNSKETKKDASSQLFGSGYFDKPKFSLFGNSNISNESNQSGSLFNGLNSKNSIFSQQNTEAYVNLKKQAYDCEDDEGDSAQLQKRQKMDIDPSKAVMKFDYKEQCKVMKTVSIKKFKKDKGQLIESQNKAILLKDIEGKTFHLVVKSSTTHTTIYSGLLIPQKSQFKILNNKTQNIEVRTFKMSPQTKKLESHIIKIQIINEKEVDDSQQFSEILRQIIDGQEEKKEE